MKKVSKMLIVLAVLFASATYVSCTDLNDEDEQIETQTIDPCELDPAGCNGELEEG
ncbi:hypothetical protein [Polaribacter sp. IC073]|uniref:hypothetical protein n=1 Tax=Polaribacter sp. IC073 TaxID=2508540 RepID=UPI0016785FF8|nr:hypothetical protein [Polaribacter sp. IC073]